MTTTQSENTGVVIFDTTLRDGEQCPGARLTPRGRSKLPELLDTMGVDIIEAGFPIASDGDFDAVNEIAKRAKNSVICGLSRAAFNDIDRCPLKRSNRPERKRIHTFLSTSPVHMKYKLQKGAAPGARDGDQWRSPRAQPRRGRRAQRRGRHAHRVRIPLPLRRSRHQGRRDHDQYPGTLFVGDTTPEEYFEMFTKVRNAVPNSDKAVFSVHCHDDLGMAVANVCSPA